MATVKIKFRPSTISGKEGSLYYQVTHRRVVRQVLTPHKIFVHEWSASAQRVVVDNAMRSSTTRHAQLTQIANSLASGQQLLCRIILKLESNVQPYSADDVLNAYNMLSKEQTLAAFMMRIVCQLKQNEQHRTARNYQSALRSFMRFNEQTDMPISMLDNVMVQRYEAWLRSQGVCRNTSSFYMRILRAVYNRAVADGRVVSCQPFAHVYTGVDRTSKRAVDVEVIKALKHADLSDRPQLDLARDVFILSFYLRGMSFVDLAHLRMSNLRNGHLYYTRSKTGQTLCIKWEKPMQHIIDKYRNHNRVGDLMLPILAALHDERAYHNAQMHMAYNLKKVADMTGIQGKLTFYVARHSWATIARDNHVPISVISEALGHDSERTTQIYLQSIKTSEVDKANACILALV